MERLSPDLERVGDQLVAAAERAVAGRRRRWTRLARAGAAGLGALVVAAALLPSALGPAERSGADIAFVRATTVALPVACDQPRGGRATLPACAAGDPLRIGRPRRW
jgi:hypothetical protein